MDSTNSSIDTNADADVDIEIDTDASESEPKSNDERDDASDVSTPLSSLPDRPLSLTEAYELASNSPIPVVPGGALHSDVSDTVCIVTLAIVVQSRDRVTLLGYHPADDGWSVVGSASLDSGVSDSLQRLDEWVIERYDANVLSDTTDEREHSVEETNTNANTDANTNADDFTDHD